MAYVFFDIECCDGNTMCSFGYVITDKAFRVLEREDIVINPERPFCLGRAGFRPEIELAYPRAVFKAAPPFPAHYERIRSVLTGKDAVFGHAVEGDVKYIADAARRYGLEPFDYEFVDSQALFGGMVGEQNGLSLERICETLDIERQQLHKSDDDADMTRRVVAALSRRAGASPEVLAERYPKSRGCIRGGRIMVREPNLYKLFLSKAAAFSPDRTATGYPLSGKRVAFSAALARAEPLRLIPAAERLCAQGGRYDQNPLRADYFVRADKPCAGLNRLRIEAQAGEKTAKILTLTQFYEKLGLPADGPPPYILAEYTERPTLKPAR